MFKELEITPAELAALVAAGTAVRIIDVRESWEWEYNRIPGAELLPLDQIESAHAGRLAPGETIVCYCHMGMRSLSAAVWLRQQGYEGARSLAGGINRWADDIDPDMPRY